MQMIFSFLINSEIGGEERCQLWWRARNWEDRVGMFNAWHRRALCVGVASGVTLIGVMTGSASAAGPVTAPFTECPKVGAAPSCDILLVVNPDQTISVLGDSSV